MYEYIKNLRKTHKPRGEVITNEIAESKNPNSTANIHHEYIIR